MREDKNLSLLIELLNSPNLEKSKKKFKLFWTGTIPSNMVDEQVVSDENQREELKNAIEKFEKLCGELRKKEESSLYNDEVNDWFECVNIIVRKLSSGIVKLDVYVRYLIEHYKNIEREEPEEFKLILPGNKEKMEQVIKMYEEISLGDYSVKPWDAPLDNSVERKLTIEEILARHATIAENLLLGTVKQSEKNRGKLKQFVSLIDKYAKNDGEDNENEKSIENLAIFCGFFDIEHFKLILKEPSQYLIFERHFRIIFLLESGCSNEELEELDSNEIRKLYENKVHDESSKIYYNKALAKFLNYYIDHISIEKFILIIMQRMIEAYSIESMNLDMEWEKFKETTLEMQSFLNDIIKSGIIGDVDVIEIPDLINPSNKVIVSQKTLGSYLGRNSIKISSVDNNGNANDMNSNFRNGDNNGVLYLTPEVYKKMIQLLYMRKATLKDFGNVFVSRMHKEDMEPEKLRILSLFDFSNLQVLYSAKKIDDSFLESIVTNIRDGIYEQIKEMTKDDPDSIYYQFEFPTVVELVVFLLKSKIIDYATVYKYFYRGYINFSDLKEIEENLKSKENDDDEIDLAEEFVKQMGSLIEDHRLIEAYEMFVIEKMLYETMDSDDANREIFKESLGNRERQKNNWLLAYKRYRLEGLDEANKTEVLNSLLYGGALKILDSADINDERTENIADNKIMEIFREMYRDALIGFDNIEAVDPEYLQKLIIDRMFVNGELSLDDVRRIRTSLSDESLVEILNRALANDRINFSSKVNLIRNVFYRDIYDDQIAKLFLAEIDGTTYNGVRYTDVLEVLNKKEKDNSIPKEDISKEKDNEDEMNPQQDSSKVTKPAQLSKPKIYPQYIRRLVFYALDPKMRIIECKNGYTVAYSESLKSVIVEKTAELKRGQLNCSQEPYGYSTRILSAEDYVENKSKLLEELGDNEVVLNVDKLNQLVPKENRVPHNTQSRYRNWIRSLVAYFLDVDTNKDLIENLQKLCDPSLEGSKYTQEYINEIIRVITEYEDKWIDYNER